MGPCCSSPVNEHDGDIPMNPDWMGQLPESLHDTPLNQLSIPGSHDSGSWFLDKHAPLDPDAKTMLKEVYKDFDFVKDIVYNWSKAQSLSIMCQLQAGVRYFDLRLSTKPETSDICLCHGMYSTTLMACLSVINDFLDEHEKKVVLIDMNHFYGMTPDIHQECMKSIIDLFGSKLCPYLDMESMTLRNLWSNKLQVIAFYHYDSTMKNFYFWPGAKIPSPWPNTTDTDKMIKYLEDNYQKGRSTDTFYVTQGILTPDVALIIFHLSSSLKVECSEKAAPVFVKWLAGKKAGPKGINVCIMDFVQLKNYIPTLLALNKAV